MSIKTRIIRKSKDRNSKNTKRKTKRKKTRKNIRKIGGMPKKVSFGVSEEREFVTPIPARDSRDLEARLVRPCPSLNKIRPGDFPCKYKQTTFTNPYEFAEWYRDYLSNKISSTKTKKRHSENIKRQQLEETGRWDAYLPEAFRSYDEASGRIEDVRPFAETDESERTRLLEDMRRHRKAEQALWMRDVKGFREQKRLEEEEGDGSYF